MSLKLFFLFVISILVISQSHAKQNPKFPLPKPRFTPSIWNPVVKPCIVALRHRQFTCNSDIFRSYFSQHLSISAKCCKSFHEVDKKCKSIPNQKTPVIYFLLNELCAHKKDDSPPPPPPSSGGEQPVSPAPGPSDDEPVSPAPEPSSEEPVSPAPEPSSEDEPISPGPSYDAPAPEPSEDEPEPVFPPVTVMPPDIADYDPLAPSPSDEDSLVIN